MAEPLEGGRGRFLGIWRGVLYVWLPVTVMMAAASVWFYLGESAAQRARLAEQDLLTVRLARQALRAELAGTGANLLALAQGPALRDWLETDGAGGLMRVAQGLMDLLAQRPAYVQASYIDATGRQRLKVAWRAGSPQLERGAAPRSPRDPDYLRTLQSLPPGGLYFSRLDFGARAARPLLSIGTPVFDRAGRRHGVLMLDYQGERLFGRLQELAAQAGESLWLVSGEGDWMLGPAGVGRVPGGFARAYPAAWSRLTALQNRGQFMLDGALYSYARLAPNQLFALQPGAAAAGPPHWLVVARASPEALAASSRSLARRLALACLAVSGLAGLGVGINIRHEARLHRLAAALTESEARLSALVELAPDAIVVSDGAGRIVLINAQTEALFGYARAELMGQPVEILVPDPQRQRHEGYRRDYHQAPRARPMGAGQPLNGRRRDGSEFPVSISLSPIRAGPDTLVFADVRDITAQRAAEQRIAELNRRLQAHNAELRAINQELEAFSYSVSHDLRAPLRAIDGFSRLLLTEETDSLTDKGRDRLERVRRAAQQMGTLIDDLLMLARVTRTELQLQQVDLSGLAAEVVGELARQEPARRVALDIAPGLAARGDAKLLRIALYNLIGNAWKFTGGKPDARIEFGLNANTDEPVYYVRDNGAGFDMTYADKLFGAFQRLHGIDEFPGTGIGLATVQRIIHKHGGRIWADARPGAGATFHFTLAREVTA